MSTGSPSVDLHAKCGVDWVWLLAVVINTKEDCVSYTNKLYTGTHFYSFVHPVYISLILIAHLLILYYIFKAPQATSSKMFSQLNPHFHKTQQKLNTGIYCTTAILESIRFSYCRCSHKTINWVCVSTMTIWTELFSTESSIQNNNNGLASISIQGN